MRRSSHAPEMDFGYATSVDDIFDTPAKSHDDWTADDVEEYLYNVFCDPEILTLAEYVPWPPLARKSSRLSSDSRRSPLPEWPPPENECSSREPSWRELVLSVRPSLRPKLHVVSPPYQPPTETLSRTTPFGTTSTLLQPSDNPYPPASHPATSSFHPASHSPHLSRFHHP